MASPASPQHSSASTTLDEGETIEILQKQNETGMNHKSVTGEREVTFLVLLRTGNKMGGDLGTD